MTAAVIVSLRIGAPPLRVFELFTGEIGRWWVEDPLFMLTPRGDGRLSLEPGTGGRLLATFDDGAAFEVGRVTVWQPGERLALTWRPVSFSPDQATEVDVRFEAVGATTRVTVEHRGWDTIPQKHVARHGFDLLFLQRLLAAHWLGLLRALEKEKGLLF